MARLIFVVIFLLAGCGGTSVVHCPSSPECDGIIVHVKPSGHFTYQPKCQWT
jgi:hypothetical protein